MDTRNSDANRLVSSAPVQNLPPIISPINTPEKDKTEESSQSEEIRLIICAQDRSSAKNIVTKFPDLSYIGSVKDEKRHFIFSTEVSTSHIPKITKNRNIRQYVKFPKYVPIVSFCVMSEQEAYEPEELDEGDHECPG